MCEVHISNLRFTRFSFKYILAVCIFVRFGYIHHFFFNGKNIFFFNPRTQNSPSEARTERGKIYMLNAELNKL